MSNLLAARAQMGTSLAFHIIFASLGIGLPLLLCIAEGLALWRQDSGWMTLTRRWTKAFACSLPSARSPVRSSRLKSACSGRPTPSSLARSSAYPLP
jgi:bd-type cytochrome oxidase subunit I